MPNRIEFTREDLEIIVNLQNDYSAMEREYANFRQMVELRIDSLEQAKIKDGEELKKQRAIINNMLWASSKVALFFAGTSGGLMWLGFWLTDKLHFKAVIDFFNAIRGNP